MTSPTTGSTLTSATALAGTVDGTGSDLVSLTYAFDGGNSAPATFSPAGGPFGHALDLSHLTGGAHTLTVTATDAAGNVTTHIINVTLPAAIPLTLTHHTPDTNANDVGSTFRPEIFFSRPIDITTLNPSNFYVTDASGRQLDATVVPASDGTYAWLFLTQPMPGGQTLHVTVNGSTIKGLDNGALLDAGGTGAPGSAITWNFNTVSLTSVPNTSLSGIVADPGPDLNPATPDDVAAGPDGC